MSAPADDAPPFPHEPSVSQPAAFLIQGARVHIHASFDAAGLQDLVNSLPLLIQILSLPNREPTLRPL